LNSYKNALRQAKPFAAMIKALMPVLQDFAVFSPSTHNGHSGDALANTDLCGTKGRTVLLSICCPRERLARGGLPQSKVVETMQKYRA
jgi:hypothetical protein